jgi:hypothetical protein
MAGSYQWGRAGSIKRLVDCGILKRCSRSESDSSEFGDFGTCSRLGIESGVGDPSSLKVIQKSQQNCGILQSNWPVLSANWLVGNKSFGQILVRKEIHKFKFTAARPRTKVKEIDRIVPRVIGDQPEWETDREFVLISKFVHSLLPGWICPSLPVDQSQPRLTCILLGCPAISCALQTKTAGPFRAGRRGHQVNTTIVTDRSR